MIRAPQFIIQPSETGSNMRKYALGIAASVIALACGLGVGTASAATTPNTEAPDSVPAVAVDAPALKVGMTDLKISLSLPETPLPALPSTSDVLEFLHQSILLAGRDILAQSAPQTVMATPETYEVRDDTDGSGLLSFLPTPQFIKDIGVDIDGMWAIVASGLSRVPVIGEIGYDIIEGMRDSRYWKNDYYRIMRTWSIFTAISALVIGPIVGFAAAVVIAFLLVLPITVVLLTIASIFGILALPFALVTGILLITLSGISWLLGTAAGIGLIVLGALLISGVLDLVAMAGLGPIMGALFGPWIALASKIAGIALIFAGVVVLLLAMAALIGVFFGAIMIVAPWFFLAGFFLLAAAIFLFAFLTAILLIGPISLVTIPLAMAPIFLFAFILFIWGFVLYGLTGNTNKGKQAEAVNQSEKQRQAKQQNGSKDKKSKKSKKDKKAKNSKKSKDKKSKDKKAKGKKAKGKKKSNAKAKPAKGSKKKASRTDYALVG